LPQIAAHADRHLHVTKTVEKDRTQVAVRALDEEGRVEEIGRMLGGAQVTEGIRASAREMLEWRAWAGESESKSKGESERAAAKGKLRGTGPSGRAEAR
jgi:DNA repair protein RecN (Recombination protein N)